MKSTIYIFLLLFVNQGKSFAQAVNLDTVKLYICALNHNLTLTKNGIEVKKLPLECEIRLSRLEAKNISKDTILYFFDFYIHDDKKGEKQIIFDFKNGYYYSAIGYCKSTKNYFPRLNMIKLDFDSDKTECNDFFNTKVNEMIAYIKKNNLRNGFLNKLLNINATKKYQ